MILTERKGLTTMPLTISNQHHITITHSYINGISWFCKVLSRVMSKVHVWKLSSYGTQSARVQQAKDKLLNFIKDNVGITVER